MSYVFAQFKRRAAAVGVLAAAALIGLPGVASAHVTAQPREAEQGGFAKVSFRTPNERDTAGTVQLEVTLPAEHPIPFVSTRQIPGWTVAVERTRLETPVQTSDGEVTEAVTKIIWSGGRIAPGMFEDFDTSMGPLPTDTDQLVFKALQTYDNGEVVRWIEERQEGAPEPEYPAPVLTLTKAVEEEATAAPAGHSADHDEGAALEVGVIGAVLGVIGTVLGVLALRRRPGPGAG
ncbi:MAG: YcnI family copper-binding membrane protein [Pseudonocardiales bacterium]